MQFLWKVKKLRKLRSCTSLVQAYVNLNFEIHKLKKSKKTCSFLFVCLVAQSCLTACDSMDCHPPGSSVHGIFQTRILEWVAISSSRGSSRPRDGTHVSCVSCIGRWILYHKRHLWGPYSFVFSSLPVGHCGWCPRSVCGGNLHSSPKLSSLEAITDFRLFSGDVMYSMVTIVNNTVLHIWKLLKE